MDAAIEVSAALSVAEDVWAFVIIAGDFEESLKVDAINNRGFDVCAWESYEASEKAIESFFDIIADFFGFIIIEDRVSSIALAEDPAIGQLGEIDFDRQAANETVMRKLRAIEANVFLLFGDLIDDNVSHFADVVAANGAFVGNGSGTEVPCAKACNDEKPEFLMRSHRRISGISPAVAIWFGDACDGKLAGVVPKKTRRELQIHIPNSVICL
jgi:hypothetical protein